MAVVVDHPQAAERATISQALKAALERNGMSAVEVSPGERVASGTMRLQAQTGTSAADGGGRLGSIAFRVLLADGRSGGTTRFNAPLRGSADGRAYARLADVAVDASADTLREWVEDHVASVPRLAGVPRD